MEDKTKRQNNNDLYRIGSFAKYMGVTPDFLKHYEQSGLIRSQQSESGYRFFKFNEAANILDCMSLKNQGFTIREMEKVLHGCDGAEALRLAGEKLGELEREVSFASDIIADYRDVSSCIRHMGDKDSDWWIYASQTMYFLPHTRAKQFIDDGRIYEILPQWIKHMPVVHSASLLKTDTLFSDNPGDWFKNCTWGLVVPEECAKRHNIPINDVVVKLPASKSLFYHFRSISPLNSVEKLSHYIVGKRIRALGLNPGEYTLNIKYMSTRIHSEDVKQNERFIVPISD